MREHMTLVESLTAIPDGDPEGLIKVGKLTFDQRKGIGNVPDAANVTYQGFACLMTPTQFMRLSTTRDFGREASNVSGIVKALEDGAALGSPFLDLIFDPDDAAAPPRVRGHEGRTRCEAVRRLYGEVPVLVACFPSGGMRARHLSLDRIGRFRDSVVPEGQRQALAGPNCGALVWWKGAWLTLPA